MEQIQDKKDQYAKKQFWDARYSKNKNYFDWYVQFPQLKTTIEQIYQLPKYSKILMVGCGNSQLSEQMYDAGYQNITNIDISQIVIQQMKQDLNSKNKKMIWLTMDATDMTFPDQSFDCVMDKGTLDALICSKSLELTDKILYQMKRVMKKEGSMIIITHSGPEGRKKVFQKVLDFNIFDFFFVKQPLSDMGMMINLMRANSQQNKINSILKNKNAFLKTIIQYNILKLKNKKSKPQKFKVQWQVVKTASQNPDEKTNEQIIKVNNNNSQQSVEKKIKNQVQQIITSDNTGIQTVKQEKKPQEKVKKSKMKQSFCFIFQIRYKLNYNFNDHIQKCKLIQWSNQDDLIKKLQFNQNLMYHNLEEKYIQINPQVSQSILFRTLNIKPLLQILRHYQIYNYLIPRIIIDYSNDKNIKQYQDSQYSKTNYAQITYQIKQIPNIQIIKYIKTNIQLTILTTSTQLGVSTDILNIIKQIQLQANIVSTCNFSPHTYNNFIKYSNQNNMKLQQVIKKYWKINSYLKSIRQGQNKQSIIKVIMSLPLNFQINKLKDIIQKLQNDRLKISIKQYFEGYELDDRKYEQLLDGLEKDKQEVFNEKNEGNFNEDLIIQVNKQDIYSVLQNILTNLKNKIIKAH